jgi:putative solute:sodium symporter small subunit
MVYSGLPKNEYRRRQARITIGLLVVWAVSAGCSIAPVNYLNYFQFLGYPLGFWMAFNGSVLFFVLLVFIYCRIMNRLDKEFGVRE